MSVQVSSCFPQEVATGKQCPHQHPISLLPLSLQTNLPPTQSKRLSPLEAAINDVSSRSSPQPLPADAGTDVYLSDDEFNS